MHLFIVDKSTPGPTSYIKITLIFYVSRTCLIGYATNSSCIGCGSMHKVVRYVSWIREAAATTTAQGVQSIITYETMYSCHL